MSARYDQIGVGYNRTRTADPAIGHLLLASLGCPAGTSVLDLGCGTGNYTRWLAEAGLTVTGIDPSAVMLEAALAQPSSVTWLQGSGEALPFAAGSFGGAVSTHAVHHFRDPARVFGEVRRVLGGGRLVLLTQFPDQVNGYWLRHYFPEAVRAAANQSLSREDLGALLRDAGFTNIHLQPWRVPPDLTDLFWYAGKDRPELYFDSAVRAGISAFRLLCPPGELENGLARLRSDLDSGRWSGIRAAVDEALGDYIFVTARG